MGIIEDSLIEERDRITRTIGLLESEIAELPRGSLVIKRNGNKDYCYLRYREGSKVRMKYAGHAESNAAELEAGITRRRHLQDRVHSLKSELNTIAKVVK